MSKASASRSKSASGSTSRIADAVAVGLALVISGGVFGTEVPAKIVGAVRSIGDDTGPDGLVMYALTTFSFVVMIAWLATRRGKARAWPLVALAPAIVFISWIAGAHKLQISTLQVTAQLTLHDRVGQLLLASALGSDLWVFGGWLAVLVLITSALVFAYRARGRVELAQQTLDGRRVAALLVGLLLVAGVVALLAGVKHLGPYRNDFGRLHGQRMNALLALPPSVFGVAAIFIGAGSRRHGPRDEVIRDIVGSAAAACFAVILCGPILMISDSADIPGNPGPELIVQVFKEITPDARWWPIYTLPFVAPILIALLIVVGPSPRDYSPPPTIIVASGIISVVVLLLAYGRLLRANDALARLPASIVSTPIFVGQAETCHGLPESRLVHVTATDVVLEAGLLRVPFLLPFDGTCANAVKAIDELGKTESVWLAVDPATPFGQVSCIVDELSRLRSPRVVPRAPPMPSPSSLSRSRLPSTSYTPLPSVTSFPGCEVFLAGRSDDGRLRCKSLVLLDRRCAGRFDFSSDEEKFFEVVLSSEDSPTTPSLRWLSGSTWISERTLSSKDKLADVTRDQWKMAGEHIDAFDRKFDSAAIRALPTTRFGDVEEALELLATVMRPFNFQGTSRDVPAFRAVSIASIDFPRFIVTDSMLPPFAVSVDASEPERSKARNAFQVARRMCSWGGCSTRMHAQIEWAEIVTTAKFREQIETDASLRRQAVWTLARARILDPSMPAPNLDFLKQPLPRLRVEPRIDATAVEADGIEHGAMARYLDGLKGDLLDCTMSGLRLGGPEPATLDVDIKLEVGKSGRVTRAESISPPSKSTDFGRSSTLRCAIRKLRGTQLSPPSASSAKEAQPVLHLHVVTPQH